MDNRLKIYVAILILIFIGIAFIEVNRPQEIDWRPHYTTSKKTPYGLYVLDKELKKLCNGIYIEKLNETPYEFFDKQYDYDSSIANYTIRGTYFSVEENSNLDQESASEILHFVSKGNEAFLAASSFSQTIFDSLKIKLDYSYDFNDTVQLKLDYVDTNTYYFNKINYLSFFDSFDTSKVTVLGHVQVSFGDSIKSHVNFIRVAYGDGFISYIVCLMYLPIITYSSPITTSTRQEYCPSYKIRGPSTGIPMNMIGEIEQKHPCE